MTTLITIMIVLQDALWPNPRFAPYQAEAASSHGWLYRVLRIGENPANLRQPPTTAKNLPHSELRALLLEAVANGNQQRRTSPFLHFTRSLGAAISLIQERAYLYSNWIVRIPTRDLEGVVDISTTEMQKNWFYQDDC